MDFERYERKHLAGILRLCEIEQWPSMPEDPARAHRAFSAPGVTTLVAVDDDRVIAFAQMLSDGEVQAYLCLIAVDSAYRRRGIARDLIEGALDEAGGLRVDLLTDSAEDFYATLPHVRQSGFRLYPRYTGPDPHRSDVRWENGRIVDD